MNGVGAGVREIRIGFGGARRVLYVAKFAEVVYVLHALGKKTPRAAQSDLDLAAKRYSEVAQR